MDTIRNIFYKIRTLFSIFKKGQGRPAMNVCSTTILTGELKPFETPFLSTDDPRFSWLKHQFFNILKTD